MVHTNQSLPTPQNHALVHDDLVLKERLSLLEKAMMWRVLLHLRCEPWSCSRPKTNLLEFFREFANGAAPKVLNIKGFST